ncbi:MAG: NfeD family protein [Candidatus Thiothrix putei]|jgi:Membrane protein implicated in regulation of membrane protease activity|uniref:NfeD-like C-terminal, partner-binding n=2 Tax=Thiothrix TaxID=1030 RepID=A0A1H4EPL2_9GAMM|nr:NfeD family protein [Thiothrix caldifontis]WGZ95420.1 MAG: NfeD family protein [Candidatus Thiothrix putei]SEA86172.1 NfeD-like C-terminal, partner-binding [Thiothrix caldifontis]
MEQEKQQMTLAQRLQKSWADLRQTNLRAQAHYAVFRTTQHIKNKNGLVKQYQQRFIAGWEKWLGVGAGITGLLMLLNPDSLWRWQFVLVLISVLLAPLLANLFHSLKKVFTEYPGKQLIGQVITLEQPIVEGTGTIRLDNLEWQLAGVDCLAGTQARIIAINDRTLYITPLNQTS